MATTDNSSDPNIVGFKQSVQNRNDRNTLRKFIREKLELCSKALARGEPKHYLYVAETIRDELLPALEKYTSKPLEEYDRVIEDEEWDWSAFIAYHRRANDFVETLKRPQKSEESLTWRLDGYVDGVTSARKMTERALHSIAAVASHEGVVAGEYKNEADATGFSIKVGIHKQRPDMDFGDPVPAIRRDLGALKSYYTGETGGGKSNGASRQVEDYYRASLESGRDYKIMDPAGLNTENINCYDVPQWQEDLQGVREEHELAPDWTEIDGYEPEAEILIPLSPDLKEFELPYDVEDEKFVPRPFTIPACDLSAGLLAAYLEPNLSDGERRTLMDAYRTADRNNDDWGLNAIAKEIKSRDELSEKDRESTIRALRNLQSQGFIQTSEHEYALDREAWRKLFHSTNVVTVFSQNPLETKRLRYFVIAYLVDRIWNLRIRSHEQPNLVTWLRELHEVAPHREIRRKESDTVENLMEYIVSTLYRIMRKPRDINTHVVADTQDPDDVERGVREMFNRYVVFGGSDEQLKDIFSWAGQNNWHSLKGSLPDKPGHAGIVKGCEPATRGADRWGMGPVHLTPPSWHHHDKDEGPSGWKKRTHISQETDAMNNEELRTPKDVWGLDEMDGEADIEKFGASEDDEEPNVSRKEYAKQQARQLYSMTDMGYRTIAEEIPDNPETGKSFAHTTVEQWVSDIEKNSKQPILDDRAV